MMVTLDGFIAGPNGDIDWHNVDDEFNEYAIDLLNSVDTLLFGRVTYQGMASYWPTPMSTTDDPIVAAKMNSLPKVVFSHTLETVEWQPTRLAKGNLADEIATMKQQPGGDMVIFGSGSIVSALAQLGLIDEYRLFVNPVAIGDGQSLFRGITERLNLRLVSTRPFRSGNVLLQYQPRT
ncbi:MAG: dihydrofolate reductase family protein [Ktedonobacterales bacterium]